MNNSDNLLIRLPPTGSVLGVDVGFSPTKRSSAVCRLDWDDRQISWTIRRFRAAPPEQTETISAVAGQYRLEAAAFDGPLRAGFEIIGQYRVADRLLTKRLQKKIGKPGQSNAPVGIRLNAAANVCVKIVLANGQISPSAHAVAIDTKAVVEAFPTAFLGVMLRDPTTIAAARKNRSDLFFQSLVASGSLQLLMTYLLPDRFLTMSLEAVTNHDDRAALICAITALCVAAGDFSAVGDSDGWIILPPRLFTRSWARADLEANVADDGRPECYYCTAPGSV